MLSIFAACAITFILCARGLIENGLTPFDNLVYRQVSRWISPNLTQVMRFVSGLGSSLVIFLLWAALAFWSLRNKEHRLFGTVLTVNLATAVLINLLFKMIFHRERPDLMRLVDISGYSFPSGHSMIGTAFYGYLAYLCAILMKKPWKTLLPSLLFLLVLLIGLSRIYLGVHFASDVAAGLSAGFCWVAAFVLLTRFCLGRR